MITYNLVNESLQVSMHTLKVGDDQFISPVFPTLVNCEKILGRKELLLKETFWMTIYVSLLWVRHWK